MLATACVVATASSPAATSNLSVTLGVLSATEVDTTGCAPNTSGITTIGVALPGVPAVSTDDCVVGFGSTNDTARLTFLVAAPG